MSGSGFFKSEQEKSKVEITSPTPVDKSKKEIVVEAANFTARAAAQNEIMANRPDVDPAKKKIYQENSGQLSAVNKVAVEGLDELAKKQQAKQQAQQNSTASQESNPPASPRRPGSSG